MYAVFVNDGFDSIHESKEAAKDAALQFRSYGYHARIHKLTRKDKEMLGINAGQEVNNG